MLNDRMTRFRRFIVSYSKTPWRKSMLSTIHSMDTSKFCWAFLSYLCNFVMHWGRVRHILVSRLATIGSDYGLSPNWCQTIVWTNGGILLIRTLGTNFNEILSVIIHFYWIKCIWMCRLRHGGIFVSVCQAAGSVHKRKPHSPSRSLVMLQHLAVQRLGPS